MKQQTLIWMPAGVALVAGLSASLTSASARQLSLITLLASGLALALIVSLFGRRGHDDEVLGGAGYHAELPTGVRILHGAITTLYTLGLMVVVFAGLVRFGLVPTQLDATLVQGFPFALGLYVTMLAGAAAWRRLEHNFIHTWYTRFHGTIVGVASGLIVLAAVAQMAGAEVLQPNDVAVLVLVGLLGVGTQMMFTTGLPTTFDLLSSLVRSFKVGDKAERTATPPVVYAAILALLVAGVFAFVAWRFRLLDRFGNFGTDEGVYFIAIVPVALACFFAISAFAVWREGRRGLYKKKISTKLRNDLMVYGFSALAGVASAAILVRLMTGDDVTILGYLIPAEAAKDFIALTILVTTGPIGFYLHKQHVRTDHIENRLPDLLNDLAESRRAGLTLPTALRAATRADYGALSVEVQKMADQVAWGVAFNDALAQFADRIRTPLVQRSTQLVIEASRTGGSVAQILKAAARDVQELKGIEQDRRVTMATYLIVIYVVFFVFLVVLGAMDAKFIPEVLAAGASTQDADVTGITYVQVDPAAIRFVYFNAAVVQAIGNGLVGGVLSEGRVTAGFRHVALMVFLSWVVFRLLLAA